MPLNLFYTMVQKSQKWPKTQIKGGSCLKLRLRPHVYVFKKIRFRKDPFWGVHIRRPRSHGCGLIQGNAPPPENHGPALCSTCVLTETDSLRAQIALFLFVSSSCQCRSSVLRHVLVPKGRSVRIIEASDKRKAPKAKWNTNKRRSKWNEKKTPDLRLSRRRGRVAFEDNSNHPLFCFRRIVFEELLSKKKMSCYWFRQWDCTCTWSNRREAIDRLYYKVWVRDGASGPGPGLVPYTLLCWKQWSSLIFCHDHSLQFGCSCKNLSFFGFVGFEPSGT